MGFFEGNYLELKDSIFISPHFHIISPDSKEELLFGDTFAVREGDAQNLPRTVTQFIKWRKILWKLQV
jgi:hypothetical protein